MAKIRNVSGERRFVAELGRDVDDDELFDLADDRAAAFEAQPYFRRDAEAPRRPARAAAKDGE